MNINEVTKLSELLTKKSHNMSTLGVNQQIFHRSEKDSAFFKILKIAIISKRDQN